MNTPIGNPSAIRNLSISSLRGLNANIYLVQNDRNYDAADMCAWISRYAALVLKGKRTGREDKYGWNLAMALSWCFALSNRFHIDLEEELWKRFPGVCPYCRSLPCLSRPGMPCKNLPRTEPAGVPFERPSTLDGFQIMCARIYPHNSFNDAIEHLSEEATELSEAVKNFHGTHRIDLFAKVIEELVDVVTNIFAVASCLIISIAHQLELAFEKGCPGCGKTPCGCGFTVNAESKPAAPADVEEMIRTWGTRVTV